LARSAESARDFCGGEVEIAVRAVASDAAMESLSRAIWSLIRIDRVCRLAIVLSCDVIVGGAAFALVLPSLIVTRSLSGDVWIAATFLSRVR